MALEKLAAYLVPWTSDKIRRLLVFCFERVEMTISSVFKSSNSQCCNEWALIPSKNWIGKICFKVAKLCMTICVL